MSLAGGGSVLSDWQSFRGWGYCSLATLCISLAATPVRAEDAPSQSALALSLRDALLRAAGSSDEKQLAAFSVEAANAQRMSAQSELYPQVSLSASYERTLASEFDGAFAAPAAATGDPQFNLDALPFGRENVYRAGVTVSQNLYAGGRTRAGIVAARALSDRATIGLGSADAETTLATVEAYYDALLSDRFLLISTQTMQRAEATLEQVRLSRGEGQQSEFELLRARVALENQRPDVVSRQVQRELAYLRLRQRLGVDPERELRLTSSLEERAPVNAPPGATVDVAARAPVRQAALDVRASEANADAARASYYPSVSVGMSYGRVNYPDGILPSADWRTNWTVGASASWSVFEGFRTRAQVLAAQAEVGRAQTRLRQTQKLAHFEAQMVLQQQKGAEAVFQASASYAEQARRAHEIAELRYREGVSTQLELTDARLSLAQAETHRAQAARDLEVARVRRALLVDLPLANAATMASNGSASASSTTGSPSVAVTPASAAPQTSPSSPTGGF